MEKISKYWGEIWKAWWAACFWERELWGNDIEDLLSCLRKLMALKYDGLVKKYSTNTPVIRVGSRIHDRAKRVPREDVDVEEASRRDAATSEWLGPFKDKDDKGIFGYLATTIEHNVPFYADKRDKAVSIAVAYTNRNFKGNLFYIT